MIELTSLKELMLIKQVDQKSVKFFQPYICNGCHDILLMSSKLNDIVILNI